MEHFTEHDADGSRLGNEQVAVVGYGNLGRSIALNLADAGIDVVVGNIDDEYRARARADGFEVSPITSVVTAATAVFVLVPDEEIAQCFRRDIRPALRDEAAVVFASGYPLAFGLVEPPESADVLLIAPRMVGENVREATVAGDGFVSYVSVEQDATGSARARLLALAAASGCLRGGAFGLSAADEAVIDLFVEQTIGPVLGTALQAAFAAGTASGIDPEALVLELYGSGEMAHTFRAFAADGFFASVLGHGFTAAFGGYLRTLDIDLSAMVEQFTAIADDIRSGGFARKLQAERDAGSPTRAVIAAVVAGDDTMSAAERRLRAARNARSAT